MGLEWHTQLTENCTLAKQGVTGAVTVHQHHSAARSFDDSDDHTLVRPRLAQGMLISGTKSEKAVDPIPYGVAQSLNLNSRSNPSEWEIIRRPSGIFARRIQTGSEVNITADSWEATCHSGGTRLRFQLALDDATLIEARQILERCHPRKTPASGVYLLCYLSDENEQEKLRSIKSSRPVQEPWSSAWHIPKNSPVGCIVISRLFHGNPKGRKYIRDHARSPIDLENARRREIVNDLGIAWISRIAVDAPYRGLGIGEALSRESLEVARFRLPWQPNYLEVIRTVTQNELERVAAERHAPIAPQDFLTRAGYIRAPESIRCAPYRPLSSSGQRMPETESCLQFYYWSPVHA